jgi:hypothetical protein
VYQSAAYNMCILHWLITCSIFICKELGKQRYSICTFSFQAKELAKKDLSLTAVAWFILCVTLFFCKFVYFVLYSQHHQPPQHIAAVFLEPRVGKPNTEWIQKASPQPCWPHMINFFITYRLITFTQSVWYSSCFFFVVHIVGSAATTVGSVDMGVS